MKSISNALNKTAQFIFKLMQVGFKEEWLNQVINSKNNEIAKEFVKLMSDDYVLVEKPLLLSNNVINISESSREVKKMFNENNVWHLEHEHSFQTELRSLGQSVEIKAFELEEYILRKDTPDNEIIELLGKEKALPSKKEAFVALSQTMLGNYLDHQYNIVFYRGKNGNIYSLYNYYDGKKWDCLIRKIAGSIFKSNDRIFVLK